MASRWLASVIATSLFSSLAFGQAKTTFVHEEVAVLHLQAFCQEDHANRGGGYEGYIWHDRINGRPLVEGRLFKPFETFNPEAGEERARTKRYEPPNFVFLQDLSVSDIARDSFTAKAESWLDDSVVALDGYATTCQVRVVKREAIKNPPRVLEYPPD